MKNNFCRVQFTGIEICVGFDFAITLMILQDRFSTYAKRNNISALKESLVNAMVCETLNFHLEKWGRSTDEQHCRKYIVENLKVEFSQEISVSQNTDGQVAIYDLNLKELVSLPVLKVD